MTSQQEALLFEQEREKFDESRRNPKTNRTTIPTYTIGQRTFHGFGREARVHVSEAAD